MSYMKIAGEDHWHQLRRVHVGASESAALFGMTPWLTPWQLWMIKAGKLAEPNFDKNRAVQQGLHFEPAIAAWASAKFGITLRKVHRYMMDDVVEGMGATLDYEQVGTGKLIPTEIKWVVRGEGWEYEGDTITQTPDHYLMQVQHQMACAGADEAQHIVFIDGDVRRAYYSRSEPIIEAIRARISNFWQSMVANEEPAIDFKADAEAYLKYAAVLSVAQVIDDDSPMLADLVKEYLEVSAAARDSDARATEIKAEITKLMADAAVAKGANDPDVKVTWDIAGVKISSTLVAGTAGKTITPDMVGTSIYARGPYRKLTINPKKEKKDKENGEPEKT